MRSSVRSSATSPSPQGNAPTPESFALTGPSRPLDPLKDAVRPDLADVRLAARVFAPHYAAHSPRVLIAAAPLRAARDAASSVLAELAAGEPFELLDVTGTTGWGVAPAHGLVGYVEASALARADEAA